MFTPIFGKRIHYQVINSQWINTDKALLVFLHEGLGSIGQWKQFPQQLADALHLPALVYERIGYGQSDYWEGPISSKFLHFEGKIMLPQLLKSLNINQPIILFGHSDGGTIALIQSANALPQLLASVVEAPHVMLEEHSLKGIEKARELLQQPDLLRALNRYQNGRAEQLIDQWTSHWLKANLNDWEAVEEMKQIKVPLLLIQGDQDEYGTFAQIERVAENAQSKTLAIMKIENCGHVPHLQYPEKIIDACRNFLNSIEALQYGA